MELANCHQKETVKDVKLGIELTKLQQEEMMDTLERYAEVFSDIPSKTDTIEHKIELIDNNSVRSRPYPLPYAMRENLKKEIQDMLSLGIIRESNSPFASPIVIVKKKDGSDRICEIKQAHSSRPGAHDRSRRCIPAVGEKQVLLQD